ncbi:izumo sperm-egg fusion protein 3 isoform X2 [Canis lupus baileyi]|uniref:izumo sperm-egg fusion protein 3 isoform X3 n=1 Tax=Canis lupus familiaris TaxID=9615 RepID=UPI0003AE483D|nr:izumo sperm-egg fusion protein 3 isoform X3 [Canis lupus familiaris]XP_025288906.1 izumo sperm-egg fusion protein 3 isoform X2 [Canis lupus dingo]XP_038407554.1 izumo sperm-egg fusion protein 3 isoform X3 [Canis lupus familiaris]XP_038536949.1 izumo sperm-egg fusion protein 3 isoform X3 [Canis lupus familiaris]|eukprot:XP_005626747.1 izumo sperm-egg fusion protein 3 isoform X2 [Canis lupus familiaris]
MGDLWLLLFLPLSLAAFHGVKGCLECDPKFTEDIRSLLAKLIPSEVPGRIHLLERQIKEMIRLSFKVSHRDKMLRVLAVQKVTKLRTWLKNELYKLGNETFKACSEDCVVIEGPVLDCWTCLRITSRCFRGEYCGEEDSRKAENREIALFLILLAEVVILGSALLLFYICVSHRRKMKAIRRSLKKYLEKKLEELMGMTDDKMDDFGIRK